MNKIHILFFTLFLVIGSFFASIATYAEDFSGAMLTEGAFRTVGDSPSAEDILNDLMFKDATISIDKFGKITGQANTTLSEHEFSGTFYSGTATLNMTGDYDYKKKRFDGTFSVNHTLSWEDRREEPLVSHTGNWTMIFEGTFSGGQSVEEGTLIIDFTGTKKTTGKTEGSNGVVDEYDRSIKWNNRAIFSDFNTPMEICSNSVSDARPGSSFSLIPVANAIDSGARFTVFSGEVTVMYQGDPDSERPAEQDMVLEEGSVIESQSDSCATIVFADGTTFIMKPFSRIILLSGPEKQSKISLVAGKIWANVKRMVKDGSMDVTMNQAVAGIKGTTFVAEDDGTTSTLKVIDGSVEYRSLVTGETTMIEAGQISIATKDGLSETKTFDVGKESAEWDRIKTNLAGESGEAQVSSSTTPLTIIIAVSIAAMVALFAFLKLRKKRRLPNKN